MHPAGGTVVAAATLSVLGGIPRPHFASLSSGLMFIVTLYRNDNRDALSAFFAYGTMIPTIAVVESVAALVFSAASLLIYPIDPTYFKRNVDWLVSSSFCIVWAMGDFFLDPFVSKLVADEKSAWTIAKSGSLLSIPAGAIT